MKTALLSSITPRPAEQPYQRRYVQIALVASIFAMLIGLAVLAGWIFDFRPLMTVLPGLVAMKTNTAVGLGFAGLSLFLFVSPRAGLKPHWRVISLALAVAVTALGMLTAGEHAKGFNLGIDEFLFKDYDRGSARYTPGRMAPISAINFTCLGLALLLLRFPKAISLTHALAGCAAVTSWLAIIGYFFGVTTLYQTGHFTAVALHTAIAFLALSAGVCCASSGHGFMRVISGSGTSGTLVRRYGLAAIILPFAIGWLRVQGGQYGWFGVELGAALFAMASATTFGFLVWIGANSLRIAEGKEALVLESLQEARTNLERRVFERTAELGAANADLHEQMLERARVEHDNQQILDNSLDIICTFDAQGRFLQINRACEALWGYRPDELIGRSFPELVHEDDRERSLAAARSIIAGAPENNFENRYLRRDGVAVPVVWTATWSDSHQIMFCVARDMSARKQMEIDLRQAKETAEAATRAKGDFLANMSHEIRTPMNGVIGMTSLLLETELNTEQHHFAETIQASAESLLTVINDILDFSKIEAGKLAFENRDFDLRDTVGETLEMLATSAQAKGLELVSLVAPQINGRLRGDPGRVRQVLTNLLGNAIKFTASGEVTLSVAVDKETARDVLLRCEVKDTGIGIPPDVQKRLFRAFEQADCSTSRKFGGTGLGLAICQQLAAGMHGSIGIESTPGHGSTFWFTMRLEKQAGSLPAARQRPLVPPRLLVVDDNATSRDALRQQVVGWGFRNGCASNGEEALAQLHQAAVAGDAYPLAIIDSQMPLMDGLTLARTIKASPQLRSMHLILLTPFAQTPSAPDLLLAGIAACQQKPVRQSHLLECITEVLKVDGDDAPERSKSETTFPGSAASPLTEPAAQLPVRPERILVAEDNLVNQEVTLAHLRKLGYRAEIATNGLDVIEALKETDYEVVFMDCQMPEMDGYEAAAAIVASGGKQRPWIIAMTANSMAGDREKCLLAGMDDYISKPVRRAEIEAALARRPAKPPHSSPERPATFASASPSPARNGINEAVMAQAESSARSPSFGK